MREQTVKYARFRLVVIAMALAFSLAGLLVASSAQGDRFYMEEAGAYDPPMIYVKATRSRDRYDTIDVKEGSDGYLKFFSVKVRGQCPEKWRLNGGYLDILGREFGPSHSVD